MVNLARKLCQLLCEIGRGFEWLADFPNEWNDGVHFRLRKIRQTVKDQAKAQHSGAISGPTPFGAI